jgi:hypothetical protein
MKPNVRAAIAAITLSHSLGRKVSSVYAYSDGGYINIDATVTGDKVDGYDYSSGCHVGGRLPNLYHYGQNAHIDLKSKGQGKYDGYDYGDNCHFEVAVKGNSADIYDYGTGGYFSYSK